MHPKHDWAIYKKYTKKHLVDDYWDGPFSSLKAAREQLSSYVDEDKEDGVKGGPWFYIMKITYEKVKP